MAVMMLCFVVGVAGCSVRRLVSKPGPSPGSPISDGSHQIYFPSRTRTKFTSNYRYPLAERSTLQNKNLHCTQDELFAGCSCGKQSTDWLGITKSEVPATLVLHLNLFATVRLRLAIYIFVVPRIFEDIEFGTT